MTYNEFDDEIPSTILALDELYQQPKAEWLIPGIIPQKTMVGIHGTPATGKSLFALHLACGLATEKTVLYVAGHGQASYPTRVSAWQQLHDTPVRSLYSRTSLVDFNSCVYVTNFIRDAAIYQPKLVVIDSLFDGMLGMSDENSKDMGMVMRHLSRIRSELDTTLLFIHYPDQWARINHIIHRFCDVMIEIQKRYQTVIASPHKVRDHCSFPVQRLEIVQTGIGVALK